MALSIGFLIAFVVLMHVVPPLVAWFAARRRGRRKLAWTLSTFLLPYLLLILLQLHHRSRPPVCSRKRWAAHIATGAIMACGVLYVGDQVRLSPATVHHQAEAVAFVAPLFIDAQIEHTPGSVQMSVNGVAIALAEAFVYKGIVISLGLSLFWGCMIVRSQPIAAMFSILFGVLFGIVNDLGTSIVVLDIYSSGEHEAHYNAVRYFWLAAMFWAIALLARFIFVGEDPGDPDADLTTAPPARESVPDATM